MLNRNRSDIIRNIIERMKTSCNMSNIGEGAFRVENISYNHTDMIDINNTSAYYKQSIQVPVEQIGWPVGVMDYTQDNPTDDRRSVKEYLY